MLFPTIFVGHGNPMYAVEENDFTRTWNALGEKLPRPEAIVVISAHWETFGTKVTVQKAPPTIHDFYGFPPELFEVRYNAAGDPRLAREIAGMIGAETDESWGLDHGAWAVLRHLYPKADVPVLQISLDRTKTGRGHFEFAEKLKFLRERKVLVVGSGNIVHNLRLIKFRQKSGDAWAVKADETLKELISADDFESLVEYQNLDENVRLGIPTAEHFWPLLYVLALKHEHEPLEFFNETVELGSLSMTSLKIG